MSVAEYRGDVLDTEATAATTEPSVPRAVELSTVEPDPPKYRVRGLVQLGSLSFTWAKRGGLKSYTELATALHLLQREPQGSTLFGNPDLAVEFGYKRVLWLACEESKGRLRWRADRLVSGMGYDADVLDRLVYLPARSKDFVLTLQNVPQLVEMHEVDCVVVDYLTGFRALRDETGSRITHDLDNDFAHLATRPLRQLAAQGVDIRVVHHTNADGERARGASEYLNACDTEICLTSAPGEDRVKLEVLKQKDDAGAKPFHLAVSWEFGSTAIAYDAERETDNLKPQERTALAYLQGVGEGDPEKRTPTAVAAILGTDRSRASRVLNDCRKKAVVDFEVGKYGRREWFARADEAHTLEDESS